MFRRHVLVLLLAGGLFGGDLQKPKPPPPPPPGNPMATRMYALDLHNVADSGALDPNYAEYVLPANYPADVDDLTTNIGYMSTGTPFARDLSIDAFETERHLKDPINLRPNEFWSSPLATQASITGAVTFNLYGKSTDAAFTGRLRARLYKQVAGGADVRTLICTGTASAVLTTTITSFNFAATPAAAVVVEPGERLVLIITAIPEGGGFGTGIGQFVNNDNPDAPSWIETTETLSFAQNLNPKLYLRRTAVNGVGDFFDLLNDIGTDTETTGVVNTVGSGTEIQWTRTGGGTVLEFLSARVKTPFTLTSASDVVFQIKMNESAAQANVGGRGKIWRRRGGVDTLIITTSSTFELSTSIPSGITQYFEMEGLVSHAFESGGPFTFEEDDRVVLKIYIINIGTMGSGRTATVHYDRNDRDLSSLIKLYGSSTWKAESDPAKSNIVPSGGSLMGLSNGQ